MVRRLVLDDDIGLANSRVQAAKQWQQRVQSPRGSSDRDEQEIPGPLPFDQWSVLPKSGILAHARRKIMPGGCNGYRCRVSPRALAAASPPGEAWRRRSTGESRRGARLVEDASSRSPAFSIRKRPIRRDP